MKLTDELTQEINNLRVLVNQLDNRPSKGVSDTIEQLFPHLNINEKLRLVKLYESYLAYKAEFKGSL